jgi:hypothetical protein
VSVARRTGDEPAEARVTVHDVGRVPALAARDLATAVAARGGEGLAEALPGLAVGEIVAALLAGLAMIGAEPAPTRDLGPRTARRPAGDRREAGTHLGEIVRLSTRGFSAPDAPARCGLSPPGRGVSPLTTHVPCWRWLIS